MRWHVYCLLGALLIRETCSSFIFCYTRYRINNYILGDVLLSRLRISADDLIRFTEQPSQVNQRFDHMTVMALIRELRELPPDASQKVRQLASIIQNPVIEEEAREKLKGLQLPKCDDPIRPRGEVVNTVTSKPTTTSAKVSQRTDNQLNTRETSEIRDSFQLWSAVNMSARLGLQNKTWFYVICGLIGGGSSLILSIILAIILCAVIGRSGHEKDTLAQKKSHAMNSSGSASQPNKESVGYQTIDQNFEMTDYLEPFSYHLQQEEMHWMESSGLPLEGS